MASHRTRLPQLGDALFLTDGGIETTLIFLDGQDLPLFAAFDLLKTAAGTEALRAYFRRYAELARRHGTGLVLEAPTWRANPDWGARLGYSPTQLADANRKAIALLEEIRAEFATDDAPVVISGCVGPRGDGYVPGDAMSGDQAEAYHCVQIETFAATAADMVSAITMNYVEEAEGVARAARAAGMPVAISFTVEIDGRLPTGHTLEEAIAHVDRATGAYPAYYMINCAHPTHFEDALAAGAAWTLRIRGVRANASCMSHAELNEAPELDAGNPEEFGEEHARLKRRHPQLTVLGGCCGTDERHVDRIAAACKPLFMGLS
jgi:homocysteine S-methyltransferase